jgi:hypothetical protein
MFNIYNTNTFNSRQVRSDTINKFIFEYKDVDGFKPLAFYGTSLINYGVINNNGKGQYVLLDVPSIRLTNGRNTTNIHIKARELHDMLHGSKATRILQFSENGLVFYVKKGLVYVIDNNGELEILFCILYNVTLNTYKTYISSSSMINIKYSRFKYYINKYFIEQSIIYSTGMNIVKDIKSMFFIPYKIGLTYNTLDDLDDKIEIAKALIAKPASEIPKIEPIVETVPKEIPITDEEEAFIQSFGEIPNEIVNIVEESNELTESTTLINELDEFLNIIPEEENDFIIVGDDTEGIPVGVSEIEELEEIVTETEWTANFEELGEAGIPNSLINTEDILQEIDNITIERNTMDMLTSEEFANAEEAIADFEPIGIPNPVYAQPPVATTIDTNDRYISGTDPYDDTTSGNVTIMTSSTGTGQFLIHNPIQSTSQYGFTDDDDMIMRRRNNHD